MAIVISILVGLLVMFLTAAAHNLFERPAVAEVTRRRFYEEISLLGWEHSTGTGFLAGMIVFILTKLSYVELLIPAGIVGLICFVVALCMSHKLCIWWKDKGATLGEMLIFIVLAVIFFFIQMQAVSLVAGLIDSHPFLESVLVAIPAIILVLTIGFIVINALYYWSREAGTSKKRLVAHVAGIFAIIATTLLLIGIIINNFNWFFLYGTVF